jgi:hypothetical protein
MYDYFGTRLLEVARETFNSNAEAQDFAALERGAYRRVTVKVETVR